MENIKTTADEFAKETIDQIINSFDTRNGILIPALQKIQAEYGYLPQPAVEYLSDQLAIPLSTIYGVATFYAQFYLEPRGKHVIRVCKGTACHVRGADSVMKALEKELKIQNNETTEDGLFTLEEVACIGACGLAPAIVIDQETYGRLDPDNIPKILQQFTAKNVEGGDKVAE